jgi:hypothetical protein
LPAGDNEFLAFVALGAESVRFSELE